MMESIGHGSERILYVSDLDGTLLDADARLSPETVRMLNDAIARGALFTVATARTPATVVPIFQGVEMTLPAIVMTGAALWNFADKTFTDLHCIPSATACVVAETFRELSVTPFIYTVDSSDVKRRLTVYYPSDSISEPDRAFMEARKGLTLKQFIVGENFSPDLASLETVLFFASGRHDILEQVAAQLKATTDCAVSLYEDIYNPGLGLIEVFAAGVSKAEAILRLRDRLQADKIVVFGDNLNDLPAFAVADTAVAVGNAVEQVRERADIVIGENIADAVARYILSHFT